MTGHERADIKRSILCIRITQEMKGNECKRNVWNDKTMKRSPSFAARVKIVAQILMDFMSPCVSRAAKDLQTC